MSDEAKTVPVTEWRDVPGYEGVYQVTNDGQVRSLTKYVRARWGCLRRIEGRVLRQAPDSSDRLSVSLYRETRKKTVGVHRLVALAFLADSYFEGAQVCHWDGNHRNNHVSNLRWDTGSANQLDTVRHGRHWEANLTQCTHGHPFDAENTRYSVTPTGSVKRRCRACNREHMRKRRERRAA